MTATTRSAGYLRPSNENKTHPEGRSGQPFAAYALKAAAACWFALAVIGQLLFAVYIAAFYGGAVVQGDLARWNKVLPHGGYRPGDTVGNLAVGVHLLFAVMIIAGGALQFLPQVRRRWPAWHRWNGRAYVLLVCATSLVGLYMLWFRGGVGSTLQHIGLSGDALLIMGCAVMAVRHARARNFTVHRHWALRLFMVVSAVWFFRVGLMFWIFVNKGPAGFDPETFRGPFLDFLAFAQYLLPLAVLELFLRAEAWKSVAGRVAVSVLVGTLTIAMGVGIFVAAVGMWLPRI